MSCKQKYCHIIIKANIKINYKPNGNGSNNLLATVNFRHPNTWPRMTLYIFNYSHWYWKTISWTPKSIIGATWLQKTWRPQINESLIEFINKMPGSHINAKPQSYFMYDKDDINTTIPASLLSHVTRNVQGLDHHPVRKARKSWHHCVAYQQIAACTKEHKGRVMHSTLE